MPTLKAGVYEDYLRKDAVAVLDYTFDWTDWIGTSGDVITESTIEFDEGIQVLTATRGPKSAQVVLAGGEGGNVYRICNKIKTRDGREDRRCIQLGVYTQEGLEEFVGLPAVGAQLVVTCTSDITFRATSQLAFEVDGVSNITFTAHRVLNAAFSVAGASSVTFETATELKVQAATLFTFAAEVFDPGTPPPDPEDPWMGVAIGTDDRTVWAPGNEVTVNNSAELGAAIQNAKGATPTVDIINLVPGANYTWTRNWISSGSGVNRTSTNPLVIRTPFGTAGYGPGANKARILLLDEDRAWYWAGVAFQNVTFTRTNSSQSTVDILCNEGVRDLMFEDCLGDFTIQAARITGGFDTTGTKYGYNICFRHTHAWDHWALASSTLVHGMYSVGCEIKAIRCSFDQNGWNANDPRGRDTPPDEGGGTISKHDVYLNKPAPRSYFYECIFGRAASHGNHFRAGGDLIDCMFLRNPIAGNFGYGADGKNAFGTSGGTIKGCLIIEAEDINTSNGTVRAFGFYVTDVDGAVFEDNIFCFNAGTQAWPGNRSCFYFVNPIPHTNILIRNNKSYSFTTAARCVYNPQGVDMSGVTQFGNHWEDGSNYADPTVALDHAHSVIMPIVRTNGIVKEVYAGWLQAVRDGFEILP